MGLGRNLLFLAHILLNIVLGLAISRNYLFAHSCYNETGSYYTANSTYQTNLNTLLSSLSSNTDRYGFYSSSLGNNPDRVNAILLCRGDLDLETCRECIKNSTSELTQYCPNSKQAIIWYTYCMLRYSNEPINGILSTDPNHWATDINASSVDLFNQALGTLLDKLTSQAASSGTLRKYATGNEIGPNFQYIYGLAQCTPDLSERNCTDCLRWIMTNSIPVCCSGQRRMWYFTPSCHLRYENFNFINSIPAAAPPDSTPAVATPAVATPGKDDNTTRTVIIVVLAVGFVIVVCICILLRKRKQRKPRHILLRKRKQGKRRKSKRSVELFEDGYGISTVESLEYDFDTIKAATDNFSDANKLGQGGFGAVYKGKLENGQEIAVKRLSKESGQGELEFKNEATLVARLQHRNLVQLLGFCLEGTERLLIYEFMTNSSLDHSIFDPVKRAFLDWERRYKIIRGIARGLVYLHEDSRLRIIHRDLKASNVLLDTNMNPKISDFGMARLFVLDETQGSTSRIVGTYGYMAPEYAMHGQFSFKSDVFSYGVLVLEIVSGQKNNCFRNGENVESLLSHAWKSWREGSASNLIDPTLRASFGSIQEMMRCIHIGLLCVQENVANRPTMASVILMLNSPSLTLYMPTEPSFFLHNSIDPEMPLLHEYDSRVSNSDSRSKYHSMSTNEDSIVELHPR